MCRGLINDLKLSSKDSLRLRDTDTMGLAYVSLCCQQTVKELALLTDTWISSRPMDKQSIIAKIKAVSNPLWQAQNHKT